MINAPVAPWVLEGEGVVGLVRAAGGQEAGQRLRLPPGLDPAPGPLLVVAARWTGSPVGDYLELAVGQPARVGLRPGWCITTMVVDSPESRVGGRLNWGFPKELGSLAWESDAEQCSLRWAERDITVRGRPGRLVLPVLVPMRSVQRRSDGPVVVPARLRGLARLARVAIEVPEGDDLAGLAGSHRGLYVGSMRFVVRPARTPVGLTSSLRAPLRSPEPALSSSAPGD